MRQMTASRMWRLGLVTQLSVLAMSCTGDNAESTTSNLTGSDAGESTQGRAAKRIGSAGVKGSIDAGPGAASAGSPQNDTAPTGTGGMGAPAAGGMGVTVPGILCGDVPCPQTIMPVGQPIPGVSLALGCCADVATSRCGTLSTSMMLCEAPPATEPRCPMALGRPGCCAGANMCGVDASPEGMGCVEIGELAASLAPAERGIVMLPARAHCDGSALSVDAGH
jgi:hypothetical protein